MHFLYLDESGSNQNQNEDYFVLGGVSVPEKSVRWLSQQLNTLAEESFPDLSETFEFHAATTFNRKVPPWNTLTRDQSKLIILKVLHSLDRANPDVVSFACAVHKLSFKKNDPVTLAFENVADHFNLYLQRISTPEIEERGMIIFDETSYESSLQTLATTFRKSGNRWGNQLRNIIEVPFFVDSKASRLIQLADHIAYATFRYYNADDNYYFKHIVNRFDQAGGVFHGLIHKQYVNRSCTCPACITRR